MSFLRIVLEPPSYGFERDGALYVPTHSEIFREFLRRLNIFSDRKNWLALWTWTTTLSLAIPLYIFLRYYATLPLLLLGFVYSMVILGTHGTIYLHRYSTHRAFRFSNGFARFLCKNLVIKLIPEETYVISHYVHHAFSEKPGDPYNVHAGWLYCFLADVNHQAIARNLSEKDYTRLAKMLDHTGVHLNSYAQYQKWGSICHPFWTILNFVLSWGFWFSLLYWMGGFPLVTAIFGMAGIWAIGVRTYNYDGHGGGKDKRQDGIDFNRDDLSINQLWPGYVAGEWHNNHHLYPSSARCGFLPYQLDLAWIFIRFYKGVGGVKSCRDDRENFLERFYRPYLASTMDKGRVSVNET